MDRNEIQAIKAENNRLKRMMNRMYDGVWGLPLRSHEKGTAITSGYLPLYLSTELSSDRPIENRITQTMDILGQFADVSRIYIFENNEPGDLFSNTYEWCNEGVESVKNNLQNLSYSDFIEWRRMLTEEGQIKASNIKNLPEEVHESLSEQGIMSLLVYPLLVKDVFYGFIGFDECSFNREWLPHETDLLHMASRLIGHTFERETAANEINRNHVEILKVNKELADKEQFLQNILSSAPVGILLVRNRIIEYVNEATLVQSGYSHDELVGLPLANLYYAGKQDINQVQDFYQQIKDKGIGSIEAHLKGKFGDEYIVRALGTPAPKSKDDDSFLIIGEDITHFKKTEDHLRESEERNRKLIEATIDGIFIINDQMKLMYGNTSACEMLLYTQEEVFNLTIHDLFPTKEYLDKFIDVISQVKGGNDYKGDTQLINKNKEIVHAEVYVTTLNLDGDLHYYTSIHNITKRKNNEESLKNNEQKYRALTENSPDHIIRIDHNGVLLYCNPAFLNSFDLDKNKCVGNYLKLISELPKELVDGLSSKIDEVVQTATPINVELEYRFKDFIRAFDWTITPETNNAQTQSLLIVGRDYTQKKKAEQELVIAKEKAIGADKLKSAFLANMSHEIRTPLNAIVGFTNLLKEESISEEEKAEYVDIVNKSSENLMELINDIVDLAKIESGELTLDKEPFNVIQLLKELHLLFEKRMAIDQKTHLKFYLNLPDNQDSPMINGDQRRLRQVFINLLGNAFKFTQKGFVEFGYTLEGNQMRFYVRDTGIGITPEKQTYIFEPFRQADESTSKIYGGTGLGLSICKRLLEGHDSTIDLISEPETGSEFFFSLPFKAEKPINGVEKAIKAELPKVKRPANYTWSNKMMLLIDATSTAQLQMRKTLERTKITLISARTQKSARELLLKRNDIHIVLMDLEMPGLELEGFIPAIRQMGIYVPFIGQTSRSLTIEDKEKYSHMGFTQVFEKPFDSDELLHAFNDSLNGSKVN
ncbi:MAG: PAS domain S-box protein [Carboxylicivirga sp.]|nr:PAS domain S-box protein [Carboxylicivirga sp.]